MPFRFTKNFIHSGSIVSSREFDASIGTFVDVVNGGLDRDNLPQNCIGTASVPTGCYSAMKIFSNLNPDDDDLEPDENYVEPTPNRLGRLMYGYRYGDEPVNSGSSWVTATIQAVDCEEGMVDISWHCSELKTQYWAYWKDHSTEKVALKNAQWQIRIDGNIVYTSAAQYEIMNTSIHRCCVPISKGTHSFSVHWKVPLQRDDDRQNQVVFNWWGGQLVIHNKYR